MLNLIYVKFGEKGAEKGLKKLNECILVEEQNGNRCIKISAKYNEAMFEDGTIWKVISSSSEIARRRQPIKAFVDVNIPLKEYPISPLELEGLF